MVADNSNVSAEAAEKYGVARGPGEDERAAWRAAVERCDGIKRRIAFVRRQYRQAKDALEDELASAEEVLKAARDAWRAARD